ncbi:hypothetical protein JCM4914_22940 [Streptomyces platensis subsp. malvinus]
MLRCEAYLSPVLKGEARGLHETVATADEGPFGPDPAPRMVQTNAPVKGCDAGGRARAGAAVAGTKRAESVVGAAASGRQWPPVWRANPLAAQTAR